MVAGECSFVCRECFPSWLNTYGIDDYINKPNRCIPSEAAEQLVESGKIRFVQRYIGGMTDPGRGGSYGGEHVENGQPKEVVRELLKAKPKGQYICSHDESGQFQVYWSVYEVIPEQTKRAKRRA
jgi:hypothetical protein